MVDAFRQDYMNIALELLQNPTISLFNVQIAGLLIVLASRESDEDIIERSGTYWDSNPHMRQYLVTKNIDLLVGILTITLPTILSPLMIEINLTSPFWFNYTCLFCALALRLSPFRAWHITHRIENIQTKELVLRRLQHIAQLYKANKKTKNLS